MGVEYETREIEFDLNYEKIAQDVSNALGKPITRVTESGEEIEVEPEMGPHEFSTYASAIAALSSMGESG